jgi:FAD/FMN-containing dehydrogenase
MMNHPYSSYLRHAKRRMIRYLTVEPMDLIQNSNVINVIGVRPKIVATTPTSLLPYHHVPQQQQHVSRWWWWYRKTCRSMNHTTTTTTTATAVRTTTDWVNPYSPSCRDDDDDDGANEECTTRCTTHSHLRSITYHDVLCLQKMLLDTNTADPSQKILLTSYDDTISYLTDWTGHYKVDHPLCPSKNNSNENSSNNIAFTHYINDGTTTSAPTAADTIHARNRTPSARNATATAAVVVAQPTTVQQVSQIVSYCYHNKIGIVPVGGRTGLVAGALPYLHESHPIHLTDAWTTTTTTTTPTTTVTNVAVKETTSTTTMQPAPVFELLLCTRKLLNYDHPTSTNTGSTNFTIHQQTATTNENITNDSGNSSGSTNIRFNALNGILQCGAGYTLQELQDFVKPYNYIIPIDIGSKGSCCIGGNVATNAGGQYYYRYNSLAANIIGLQVVSGMGEILNLNYTTSSNLKDNTGYKLHQLMIGSEGTLGIITGVSIRCPPYLASRDTMMIVLYYAPNKNGTTSDCGSRNFHSNTVTTEQWMMNDILLVIQLAKLHLGEILAAVEWMDPNIVRFFGQAYPNPKLHSLLEVNHPNECDDDHNRDGIYYPHRPVNNNNDDSSAAQLDFPHLILIETHGTNKDHDQEKRDSFLEAFISMKTDGSNNTSTFVCKDVKLAKHESDCQYFWSIRESANPATAQIGYTYKYDVSIPNSNFSPIIECIYQRLIHYHHRIVITNWGHILDGNLHLNITDVNNFNFDAELLSVIEPYIYEQVLQMGGSISAEHGLGQIKNQYMNQIHDPSTLHTMRTIKQGLDPAGIFNPGKVLPSPV